MIRTLPLFLVLLLAAPALAGPDDLQQSYDAEARGDYGSALGALEHLPQSERQTYLFHLRRAWLRYLSGAHTDAIASYQQAAREHPDAVEPLLGLTLPQLALKRWIDVVTTCDQVLKRDPGNATARGRKAWALYNLGRYADAEPVYRALVRDYPGDVELRSGLGWTLRNLDKKADAKQVFQEILAIAPRHESARAGLQGL